MLINEKKEEILICACNELLRREKLFHSSFRELLLNGLEQLILNVQSLTPKEKNRIKLIIYESELYDATNKAPIMNRESSEIFKDAALYRNFAKRVKNILLYMNNTI